MAKKSKKLLSGFTLLELLIVMSILAILAAVAVPNMQETSKTSAVRAHQKHVFNAVTYARGEAVSRGKSISMCPSADGSTCDAGNDWSNGWIVFVDDVSVNGDVDANEEILRAFEYSGSNSLRVRDPDAAVALPFISWNFRGFNRGDLRAYAVVCSSDNDVSKARGLLIERSGRAMMSRDSTSDGIHESAFDGGVPVNLSC